MSFQCFSGLKQAFIHIVVFDFQVTQIKLPSLGIRRNIRNPHIHKRQNKLTDSQKVFSRYWSYLINAFEISCKIYLKTLHKGTNQLYQQSI